MPSLLLKTLGMTSENLVGFVCVHWTGLKDPDAASKQIKVLLREKVPQSSVFIIAPLTGKNFPLN